MNSTNIILGMVHAPPIGLLKDEMETIYQSFYRPMLKVLYAHPSVKFVGYFSGSLLEWIEETHSEFIDVMVEMVKRRQLEIIGGGYYAPVYSLIPKPDRIGQIEQLTTYLRRNFGRRPRGCWVTEQIWEPVLPSSFKSAGMEYLFLDEYHFWKAGFEERDFYTPCITEDQGKTMVVFPVNHEVRQNFWNLSPDEIIRHIEKVPAEREDQIISLFAGIHHDAEDGTLDPALIEQHLERLLSRFDQLIAAGSIETLLPYRYMRKAQKRSRGYFPATSFDEMQAYGSISALERYLRRKGTITSGVGRTGYYYGSIFRQNLGRYSEVNLLYSKMQYVQSLTTQIRGDKYRKLAAREELWHGQSNMPFWHGERGGVYFNNYRKEVYSALIRSEILTRERGIFAASINSFDFDMDGLEEFLFQGNQMNAYVHSQGGILFELDYLPVPWNYLDNMGRYPEVYHGPVQESRGYDPYPRRGFIDHFFPDHTGIEQFARMGFEDSANLHEIEYQLDGKGNSVRKKLELPLYAEAELNHRAGPRPIRLEKTYRFDNRKSFSVDYRITNSGEQAFDSLFSPEMNFSFISNDVQFLRLYNRINKTKKVEIGPSQLEIESSAGFILEDLFNKVRIEVEFSTAVPCWSLPQMTEHLDRERWREIYQASTFLPLVELNLEPGESLEFSVGIKFAALGSRS
jgi:hypothetical protein